MSNIVHIRSMTGNYYCGEDKHRPSNSVYGLPDKYILIVMEERNQVLCSPCRDRVISEKPPKIINKYKRIGFL